MESSQPALKENLRITWAVASKDILEAIRNKTTLSSIVLVFLIMVAYKWLPGLYTPSRPHMTYYDANQSSLATNLESSQVYRPHPTASSDELKAFLSQGDNGALGLFIPANYDQVLASGGKPQLNAYVLWDQRGAVDDLVAEYERRISELAGAPASIQIEGIVNHSPNSMGTIRFASITFVIVIFFTGTLLVPQLMLEEKRTKTLDALLVSPASTAQIVLGKAMAGSFYCTIVSAVVLAFNSNLVVHWGLILLAFFCGTLLSVGIGLALGIFLEVKAQITTWTLILAQPLIAPVFLSIMDPLLPETVKTIFSWIPTGALVILFRHALSTGATAVMTWRHFALVLVSALLVLAAVVWRVRRSAQ